mmetsp:Transcript_7507/g.19287  ORF Transcript_7507/g.19287 Transcript_7507/m.19287 type:complete len:234 (-) Transcript_7507:448-1149(-)
MAAASTPGTLSTTSCSLLMDRLTFFSFLQGHRGMPYCLHTRFSVVGHTSSRLAASFRLYLKYRCSVSKEIAFLLFCALTTSLPFPVASFASFFPFIFPPFGDDTWLACGRHSFCCCCCWSRSIPGGAPIGAPLKSCGVQYSRSTPISNRPPPILRKSESMLTMRLRCCSVSGHKSVMKISITYLVWLGREPQAQPLPPGCWVSVTSVPPSPPFERVMGTATTPPLKLATLKLA